jgi:hypothetical protein
MKILQLCCHSQLWGTGHEVESHDLITGSDILDLPVDYGKSFDLIVSAPPCDQFSKANSLNWQIYPDYFVKVARQCLEISIRSGQNWFLENPPGRIETFLPELTKFRAGTWHGNLTNKEYIIYSSFLVLIPYVKRYGKPGSINNYSKRKRELWQQDFIDTIALCLPALPAR